MPFVVCVVFFMAFMAFMAVAACRLYTPAMSINHFRLLFTLLAFACLQATAVAQPEVEAKIDPAKAKAEFDAASKAMRDLVARLTTLQAEYQKPGSDKAKIEGEFNAEQAKGKGLSDALETSAVALVMVKPDDVEAREVATAVIAGSLDADDPLKALKLAELLDGAKAGSVDVSLLAATACLGVSRLDEADAWLAKAVAAGADKKRSSELSEAIEQSRPKLKAEMAKREAEAKSDDLPRVKLSTTKGDIVVELFENEAPNTVANFVALVEKGFYDGTPFHRVIGGFMAQGGDPTGTGTGGPGHVIECECGKADARLHFLGSLSMAHAGQDTGGSQFFLTFRPTEHLDGKHTVFGRVIEGLDVLPMLVRTEGRRAGGTPPDRIVKAEVVRKRPHPYEPKTMPDPRKR
jgi:cyclophilin family peptidyl-prolyl cis-trans isomerase